MTPAKYSASRGKRGAASIVAVAAAVAMIGVASSQGATHHAAAKGTVTIAIFQEPDTLDPAAAYLLARGMKTLEVRVRRSCENALSLAQALRQHPKVTRVYYPGLEDDPGHALAKWQMQAFGGVVAFDLVGGEPEVEKLFDSLRLVRTAPSLGGVETLASYPLYSSHVGFSSN